ncbi:MAG TPA: ATP-binding protein [Puia sp.]|nr:ATP-binding protein [Puia sp.]
MPDKQYNEVLTVLVACLILFLILAAIILVFLYKYQRRRLIQRQQINDLQQQFTEQSLQAQVEIQEQTFLAISQEIHDNVGQVLSLAKVQANIIKESQQLDNDLLDGVRENIGKAMTDLRDLSRSLNNEKIRASAIHEVLIEEVERINRTGVIRASVSVEGEVRDPGPQKKLILFRVLQESIQNCLKHAEASSIAIIFHYAGDGISVSIRDDGKGFDPASSCQGQGLGNIRTRVRLAGGTNTITSLPREGSHISLMIPYE